METANANDPGSLERIYSRADFERDARLNAEPKATVHHGLKILSTPDEEGRFTLERADRHVGENPGSFHSVFVSPSLESSEYGKFIQNDTAYGGPIERRDPPQDPFDPYRAFLEEVIRAARSAQFPPTDAAERLKGPYGG